jgi:uncharacterized protein YegJ (DUF2314 family)
MQLALSPLKSWIHAMPRHTIAAVLALVAVAGCTQSMVEWEKEYEATRRQNEAIALQRAAEQARATLDEFLVKAKQPPAGTKAYALKVGIREDRGTEYFWIDEFTWSDGVFTGRINDEPRLVKGVAAGQMHRFKRSDIVDWMYIDEKSGRTVGNFTARVSAAR